MVIKSSLKNKVWTIGLLVDVLEYGYQQRVLSGVSDAARENGVNLMCFVGRDLRLIPDQSQRNDLYQLVSAKNINGLILMSGAVIRNQIDQERMKQFCVSFRPLPVVSIGAKLDSIHSVTVDNEKGMRKALAHLINKHNCRHIAFIRGPDEKNLDARHRYDSYIKVMNEYGLSIDPDIIIQGDFLRTSGEEAVERLLNEQHRFDAIIAANDEMALGVLKALHVKNIRVPEKVAVVGFDDIEESSFFTPSLSTVHQPMYDQGKQAVKIMLALLKEEPVEDHLLLKTKLKTRRSCGCTSPKIPQKMMEKQVNRGFAIEQRARMLSEVSQKLITTRDVAELMEVISLGLSRLDIKSCYLSLYEDKTIRSTKSKLLLAYKEGKRLAASEGQSFSSYQLVPKSLSIFGKQSTFIIEPLYFKDKRFGFVLFEIGPEEWVIYEELQEQISSALDGALLEQKYKILLAELHDIGRASAGILELDRELKAIVQKLIDGLKCEFAAVWLIDGYRQTIEMFHEKNLTEGWLRQPEYKLDSPSILADIIRSRAVELFYEPDKQVGKETHRGGQTDLISVFVPLIAEDSVVGVIEAGCRREHKDKVFTDENIQTIKHLGQEKGTAIAQARPHVLLELIAENPLCHNGRDKSAYNLL